MRLNYGDEEDYSGQFALWHANCRRSLNGAKGQAVLRELEAALVALPEKRLIADALATEQGEVCAVGALLAARECAVGVPRHVAIIHLLDIDDPEEDGSTEEAAVASGVPRPIAWKLVELNDIRLDTVTPEARYTNVLAWVRAQLAAPKPPRKRGGR